MVQLLLGFSLLLFLVFSFKPISANTELRALMDIKAALDPQNRYLSTWVADGDPCGSSAFEGVACNEHRKVANISLQGKGLNGRLSPAISGLKCLSGLYLHYNSLSGEIPREIGGLNELTDLYLNVNNFSGVIPPEIGNMSSLQVLQLCFNQLTGSIPATMGSLKKLSVLALQYNQLSGAIPPSLGNSSVLKRLDLSYNHLSGPIPLSISDAPELQMLAVQNNSLSGVVPLELKRLNGGFLYGNNSGLCGEGFSALRVCSAFDNSNINTLQPLGVSMNHTTPKDDLTGTANLGETCSKKGCSKSSSRFIVVAAGVTMAVVTLAAAGFLAFSWYRRQKQKIGSAAEASDSRLSTDLAIDLQSKSASPLVSLAYSTSCWDHLADGLSAMQLSDQDLHSLRFNLEDVESATHYFSEANLLGRGKFSSVYKGVLRDGSNVAIKSINMTSCKSEEAEFIKGVNLLISLRHENLVPLRGYCCSRARGECFLIYEFAQNGNLSRYLDSKDGTEHFLDWSTRVSIVDGIAKGIQYLHGGIARKPPIVHQNISAEKILLDQNLKPLILDSGLHKILADDTVYSALKVSAAMGYLAPEYVTTGRFTEQSDVYAFGVLVLQILSGKQQLTSKMLEAAAGSWKLEELIDLKLNGKFTSCEATELTKLAAACTHEDPTQRPSMDMVIQQLRSRSSGSGLAGDSGAS
ncbi:hypothetical protein Dimus_008877 [Dionaea muscipula]